MLNLTEWNRLLYAAWAPFYDVLVLSLEGKRRKSLELAKVQSTEKVLLIGAGTGLDLKYLHHTADLSAIDITPAMLKRLRARADTLGIQVDAQIMDAQEMDFPDNSFDVVILHFVLAVIPDPVRAIKEVKRVLRPGGRAVILNKFVKDGSEPSVALRLTNKVVRLLATDITCQLAPIINASGMNEVYEEKIGLGGFFKIAILQKEAADYDSKNRLDYPPIPTGAGLEESSTSQPALTFATSAE